MNEPINHVRNLKISLGIVVFIALLLWAANPFSGVIGMGITMVVAGLPIGIALAVVSSRRKFPEKKFSQLDISELQEQISNLKVMRVFHLLVGALSAGIPAFYVVKIFFESAGFANLASTGWTGQGQTIILMICAFVMLSSTIPFALARANLKKQRFIQAMLS